MKFGPAGTGGSLGEKYPHVEELAVKGQIYPGFIIGFEPLVEADGSRCRSLLIGSARLVYALGIIPEIDNDFSRCFTFEVDIQGQLGKVFVEGYR